MKDHVISKGKGGAEFRCTPLVLEVFRRRKIFLGFAEACTGTEVLRFESGVELEPYAYFPLLAPLRSTQAFSFSFSPWPRGVRIGRYSSIAVGSSVIQGRHPIEWASSSTLIVHMSAGRGENDWVTTTHRDFNGGPFDSGPPPKPIEDIDIKIGHDVWIARDVKLAQKLVIGTGAVIATGAIVTRDVEPYMVVGGAPARIIKARFKDKLIEKFLESKWWEFGPDLWKMCDYKNPEKFLDDVARVREKKKLSPFRPQKITFRHILEDLSKKEKGRKK